MPIPACCTILILNPTAGMMMICCGQIDAGFVSQQMGSLQQWLRFTCLESRYAKGAEDSSLEPAKHTGLQE
jgi:hypothetical protein